MRVGRISKASRHQGIKASRGQIVRRNLLDKLPVTAYGLTPSDSCLWDRDVEHETDAKNWHVD